MRAIKLISTPEMDNLAKKALILKNANGYHADCAASRASILTGYTTHGNPITSISATGNIKNPIWPTRSVHFKEKRIFNWILWKGTVLRYDELENSSILNSHMCNI